MPRLHDLQAMIAAILLDRAEAASASAIVQDDRPFPAAERLRIHRNNSLFGLTEVLEATFPVTATLVGEDFFARLSGDFIRAHPPQRPNLLLYGQDLPGFIANYPAAATIAYLADMARLELALTVAYHAADHLPLMASALQSVPVDDLPRLGLLPHPSLRFVASDFPLLALWQAHQPDGSLDQSIDLTKGADHLLVYRPHQECLIRPVSKGAFAFVMALSMRQSIESAYQSALTNHPAFDLGAELAALLAAELFAEAINV